MEHWGAKAEAVAVSRVHSCRLNIDFVQVDGHRRADPVTQWSRSLLFTRSIIRFLCLVKAGGFISFRPATYVGKLKKRLQPSLKQPLVFEQKS